MQDIRASLTHYADPDSVWNLCQTDKLMHDGVCRTRAFWIPLFERYGLPLPPFRIATAITWWTAFEKGFSIISHIDQILYHLSHTFQNITPRSHYKTLPIELFIKEVESVGMYHEPDCNVPDAKNSLSYIGLTKIKMHSFYVFLVDNGRNYYAFLSTQEQLRQFLINIFYLYEFDTEWM